MAEFIPPRISDALAFAAVFSAALTAAPTDFGMEAGDATAFDALNVAATADQAAAATAKNASNAALEARDVSFDAMLASLRLLAAQMRANPDVTDETLASVGIFRRADPAPTVAPNFAPTVGIRSFASGQVTVNLLNDAGKRSLPFGVIGCEISLVNAAAAAEEGEAELGVKTFVPRSPATVNTQIGAAKIRLYSRYLTVRGEASPWSIALPFNPQD